MPSSDDPLTEIHFGPGEKIRVRRSLSDMRDLIQRGLATPLLVELIAENGERLIFNPQQVKYIRVSDAVGE